jgi:hypothetical protein
VDQALSLRGTRSRSPVDWRTFLRALAEEVDSLAGSGERDDMLRGVGRRMARLVPIPPVTTLVALEMEINDALDGLGWGEVSLHLNEADRTLEVTHTGMPRIGSLGSPAGQWLSALLEGLYDAWLGQQPGSKSTLTARRLDRGGGDVVVMSYSRR